MTLDSKVIGFVVFVTGLTVGPAELLSLEVMSSAAIPAPQHCFVVDLGSCTLFFLVVGIHNSPRMASSSFAQRASWPLCSFLEAEIALSLSFSLSSRSLVFGSRI